MKKWFIVIAICVCVVAGMSCIGITQPPSDNSTDWSTSEEFVRIQNGILSQADTVSTDGTIGEYIIFAGDFTIGNSEYLSNRFVIKQPAHLGEVYTLYKYRYMDWYILRYGNY